MQCREACGACCIAPSIARPFHGMPLGKPAGQPCVHLQPDRRCGLLGDPRRPDCCAAFLPEPQACGDNRVQALAILEAWERLSTPTVAGKGERR